MTDRASAAPRLSSSQLLARRLERQGLAAPSPAVRPADIVGRLGAVHAQVMSAAELSIGLRILGITRTDVRHAVWSERSLVKTRGPRGTVHLLATRDLPMWTGALSALPVQPSPHPEDVRLTPQQTDEVVVAIAEALQDAELTVDELTEAIVERTGPWAGDLVLEAFQGKWPRWRQAEGTAANRGALCFGPARGRKVTYTNPSRWLPGFRLADGPTALAEVARRYLYAYGPATPEQFAQWLAVPVRWARELFVTLAGDLQQVEVDGTRAWLAVDDRAEEAGYASAAPRGIRLLPYFDAYAYPVSGTLRDALYPGQVAERVSGNFQVLIADGVVAGVWHQRRSGRKLDITVEPLRPLTARQRRELDHQVARIGEFLEATPRLTIGVVTIGSHA